MTEIISAFPCMGKTTYAISNPDIAKDIESSDYFFKRDGFEHLDSEAFKGVKERIPNPNGLNDYINAIDECVKSKKYKYIFISMHPNVIKKLISIGYKVKLIYPHPTEESFNEYKQRALTRGNNEQWIAGTLPYINADLWSFYTPEEHLNMTIQFVSPKLYLNDILK